MGVTNERERFERALRFIIAVEGGISNDKDDRGGLTGFGVTQGTYNQYRRWKHWPLRPVTEISDDEIEDVYLSLFWGPLRCEDLPEPVDLVVFDSGVQHSPHTAAKLLQTAVGVTADGLIGPNTLAACADAHADDLALAIIQGRRELYQKIVDEHPEQGKFLKGWLNRLTRLTKEIQV